MISHYEKRGVVAAPVVRFGGYSITRRSGRAFTPLKAVLVLFLLVRAYADTWTLKGWNMRQNASFSPIVDSTPVDTFAGEDACPPCVTRNGTTFGWAPSGGGVTAAICRDRDNTVPARYAGTCLSDLSSSPSVFKVVIPTGSRTFDIYAGFADINTGSQDMYAILKDGTTPFDTVNKPCCSGGYSIAPQEDLGLDTVSAKVVGTLQPGGYHTFLLASDWVDSNFVYPFFKFRHTFTNDTFMLFLGGRPGGSDRSRIAYLRMQQISAGGPAQGNFLLMEGF